MKISIVVPTYNRAGLIQRTILSVLSQSMGDWELIIVDDGSNDNTDEIVLNFQKNEPRIIYLRLSTNRGVNFARNRGIEKAKGEWVAFLDSDDEYVKGAFNIIFPTLSNTDDIDVVGFMTLAKNNGEIKKGGYMANDSEWQKFSPTYEDIVLKRGGRGDTNFCIRKRIFKDDYFFPEWINGFESFFFSELAKNGKKFIYANQIVVLVHDDSTKRLSKESYLKQASQFSFGYRKFIREHKRILKKYPDILAEYCLKISRCYLELKNPLFIWWILEALFIDFKRVVRLIFNKFISIFFSIFKII